MAKKTLTGPVFQSTVFAISGSDCPIFVNAPNGTVDFTKVTSVTFEETDLPPSQVSWSPMTLGAGQFSAISPSQLSFDSTPTYNPPAGGSFAAGSLSITFLPEEVCPEVNLQSFYISDGILELIVKQLELKGLLKEEVKASKVVNINIY